MKYYVRSSLPQLQGKLFCEVTATCLSWNNRASLVAVLSKYALKRAVDIDSHFE